MVFTRVFLKKRRRDSKLGRPVPHAGHSHPTTNGRAPLQLLGEAVVKGGEMRWWSFGVHTGAVGSIRRRRQDDFRTIYRLAEFRASRFRHGNRIVPILPMCSFEDEDEDEEENEEEPG